MCCDQNVTGTYFGPISLPSHTQNQVWALGIFQNDPHFRHNPRSYVTCTHIHMTQSVTWHIQAYDIFFSFLFPLSPSDGTMQNTNSRPYASCDIAFSFLFISFFARRYNAKHKLKAICIDPGEVNTDITRHFPCAAFINAFLKIVLIFFVTFFLSVLDSAFLLLCLYV